MGVEPTWEGMLPTSVLKTVRRTSERTTSVIGFSEFYVDCFLTSIKNCPLIFSFERIYYLLHVKMPCGGLKLLNTVMSLLCQ